MGCVYSRACIGEVSEPKTKYPQITSNVTTSINAAGFPVFSPATSDDDELETRDQINQLNHTRDSELGIARLSRISGQFLADDGSRTVELPSAKFELRFSFLSQRGYYPDAPDKANQDSFCIHTPFGTSTDDHFFGVFDGHGEFGAQCSQFVKRRLCENLLRDSKFRVDAVEACHSSFLATNSQLHNDPTVDDSMSGTTAVTVLVRGRMIYVANSGDSRAVIAERRGDDIVAVDLSIDQTPFRADELQRVKLCGARVLTLDQIEGLKNPDVQCWGTEEGDDGDPPRLWVPNGMYPGTAFTRSIGDCIAEAIGVVANPELVVLELTAEHPFFVIASDGVFEFLSSQTVVEMVAKYKDPRDACAAIVAESYRLWLQYETRTDDITVIVVHINGLADAAVYQSTNPGSAPRPPIPQVVELTGSESPAAFNWSSSNQRVRHDLSRARLRAIESSLENGQVWVPPSPAHRKTWEEEAHIERALRDHFLFRKLNDSQCQVLLDCIQRVEVLPGDVIVSQGAEGDCFYVVGSGEFEVSAIQEEQNGQVTKVLQRYTAEKFSSFGELALMTNKPLQASVHAVTHGTLWALKREDFRGILMSEFSNLSSLKLLRSVDLFSSLTILQLNQISDNLSEVSFSDGQTIINWNEGVLGLYLIQKGQVRITFGAELLSSPYIFSLKPDNHVDDDTSLINNKLSLEKREGSYFGEWALFGEQTASLNAVAVGEVVCAFLTWENFGAVVGPLPAFSQYEKSDKYASEKQLHSAESTEILARDKLCLSDLEWKACVYSTDCCEIGLVLLKDLEKLLSLKRFVKHNVKRLGKESQVLKEKSLIKSVSSASVPEVLGTFADEIHAGILLNARLACPLAAILHTPLEEPSTRFFTSSVIAALEDLHKNGVLYRGISPDVLVLDESGRLQLADFRFGKKLSGERTFTICGMADSLAPEIVLGHGHGLAADWWALGVLIYYMLLGEMPFGSWRESDLDTVAKIAKGQLKFPESLSNEVVDLITKLLEVDEGKRIQDSDSVKRHPWFRGVDFDGIKNCRFPVPDEITSRVSRYMENHFEDRSILPLASHSTDTEDLNNSEWLDDW